MLMMNKDDVIYYQKLTFCTPWSTPRLSYWVKTL